MPRNCFIKNCRSNIDFTNYTPTFSFPKQDDVRYDEWIDKIHAAADYDVEMEPNDTVCIKHFEEQYVCRYMQAYDANFQKKSIQRSKLSLKPDAIPTLNLNLPESGELETKVNQTAKQKRGSSGLANLQKARIRKTQRRQRMQELLKKRAVQKTQKLIDNYDISKDYFLGEREATAAENVVVALRLRSLVKSLHDGSKLCKEPSTDTSSFPTFNIIRSIDGLNKSDENPLHWSVEDTFTFVKYISSAKTIAKIFRAEEIDGEALLNLTHLDLTSHFNLDNSTAENLMKVFTQLRAEVIERFLNI